MSYHDPTIGSAITVERNLRRSERVKLRAEVHLRRTAQSHYRVDMYDLSRHGCKLEFVERPQLDERVWVKFDTLEAIECHVCWVKGYVAGIEFLKVFHPAVFDMLVGRLRGG